MLSGKKKSWHRILTSFVLLTFLFNFLTPPAIARQLVETATLSIDSPFGPLTEICTSSGIKYIDSDGQEVPFKGGKKAAVLHCANCILPTSQAISTIEAIELEKLQSPDFISSISLSVESPREASRSYEHLSRAPPQYNHI